MTRRPVADSVLADFRSENPSRILLVQIATGSAATPYLRYTSRDHVVVWGGASWSPAPVELDETRLAQHSETSGPKVRFMDLDETFKDLIDAGYDFTYKRVRIIRTNVGSTEGAGSDGVVDDWFIDFYERAAGAISFSLMPMVAAFRQKIPLRTISRALFQGIPDPD